MIIKKKLKKHLSYKILNSMYYNYQNNLNLIRFSDKDFNKHIYWVNSYITKKEVAYLLNNHPIFQKLKTLNIDFNKKAKNKSLTIRYNKTQNFNYKKLILKTKKH